MIRTLHAIWSYNERWDFPRAGSSLFLPRFSGLTFLRFLGPFFIFSEIFAKCVSPVIGNSVLHSVMFTLKNKNKEIFDLMYVQVKDMYILCIKKGKSTARPRDTRILVPEKNRAAQNRTSWGLYLCTKEIFSSKIRVPSRLLFKIRLSQVFFRTLSQNLLILLLEVYWLVTHI